MGFRAELAKDRVGSLNLRDAIAIDPHAVVRAAIALMRSSSLGCAVLVDQDRRPIGLFTERSIIRALSEGACLDTVPVSAFEDPLFFVVQTDEPTLAVWKKVVDEGARFVCVTDNQGKLVGLTGQRGLAEYVCDCYAKQISVQRLGSSPWMLSKEGA